MGRKIIVPSPVTMTVVPDLYYSPVVPAHCTNAWFFGQDADRSCTNRVYGGQTLDMVGSPTFHDGYVEIGGDCYFDTGQVDTTEMTVLAIARLHTAGDACQIIGNLGGGVGARMVVTATSNNIQMAGAYESTSILSQMTPSGFATAPFPWRCFVGSVGAEGSSLDDMTAVRSDSDANGSSLDRALGSTSMTIGTDTGTYAHKYDLACLMTWDAVLDSDDRTEAYQALKALMAKLGNVV